MSYDIRLCDPITKKTIEFPHRHHLTGGTYELGGTHEAWLNITYNYSPHFYRLIDEDEGIRAIYGMTGAESIKILKEAVISLGDDVCSDYWEPTEGNAKAALLKLIALAEMRPDGVWSGD
ncbi:MAG: hypothetical protein FWC75_05715 [Oscillospiraceae bacterium]|nr:hypothetical protein [Oscillospiraceae bacterium]